MIQHLSACKASADQVSAEEKGEGCVPRLCFTSQADLPKSETVEPVFQTRIRHPNTEILILSPDSLTAYPVLGTVRLFCFILRE